MKRTIKFFLIMFSALCVSSAVTFSQSKTEIGKEKLESPYDEMILKFALGANPSLEDVGFDEPKSYWKFSYELRFLEKQNVALNKSGYKYRQENSGESSAERLKRIDKNNKQHNKVWKKFGVVVSKGKILKVLLLSQENREIVMPVQLSPEIRNVLARVNGTNESPDFRIQIKGKIYSKTKSNLKFKQKISSSYVCPTKMIVNGSPNWLANSCGIYIEAARQNNKIVIGLTSRL